MSTQDQELKPLPCPKCHKNPPQISVYEWDCEDTTNMANHYLTTCQDCGYTFDGRGFTEEEAITEWNRRAMGLVDDYGDEVKTPPADCKFSCGQLPYEAPAGGTKKEGWSWLFNSSRCHYFVSGKSLCGKWAVLGYGDCDDSPSGNRPCATCMKKLENRNKKVREEKGGKDET